MEKFPTTRFTQVGDFLSVLFFRFNFSRSSSKRGALKKVALLVVKKFQLFFVKNIFSFLFGGFGYGPDSTHKEDHYGTIFDSNYESQGVKYS